MELADFNDLLDRLGDDMSTWPDQSRQDAERLLLVSDDARLALAEAQRLRHLLTPDRATAPAGLVDRIMRRIRPDDAT